MINKNNPESAKSTSAPKKQLPTDVILPTLEGGNIRVIRFGMGRVIIATRPWSLPDLGVPNISWSITSPEFPHTYQLYGRVVYTQATPPQPRSFHNQQQPDPRGDIARGVINKGYYETVLNGFVKELLSGGCVSDYDMDFKDKDLKVVCNGLYDSVVERLTSNVDTYVDPRIYLDRLLDHGVELNSGESKPRFTGCDMFLSGVSYNDTVRVVSPTVLECLALLQGEVLTDFDIR